MRGLSHSRACRATTFLTSGGPVLGTPRGAVPKCVGPLLEACWSEDWAGSCHHHHPDLVSCQYGVCFPVWSTQVFLTIDLGTTGSEGCGFDNPLELVSCLRRFGRGSSDCAGTCKAWMLWSKVHALLKPINDLTHHVTMDLAGYLLFGPPLSPRGLGSSGSAAQVFTCGVKPRPEIC